MATTETTYHCTDAAERIAELIKETKKKFHKARSKYANIEEKLSRTPDRHPNRKELMSKLGAAKRDQHRAETTLMALKEALSWVLLERECNDGEQHPMPDVESYLKDWQHRQTPPLV